MWICESIGNHKRKDRKREGRKNNEQDAVAATDQVEKEY